ncbi:SH3 domain-containing protein [Reinekea blandensis]|nr:SH3 domain-containing protein [Reinekea blandensis]
MTKQKADNPTAEAFWKTHPDPTQAAVHFALQWLAFVYPASELQVDRTLKAALPYADADLSARWSQFLDEEEVEEHVQALEWVADTLSEEQLPFLIETAWRLLLVDHELPTHVPLALRILARVLSVDEDTIQRIGEAVFREYTDGDEERKRAPLLPVDPRYLDRIEWRLYGHSATTRMQAPKVARKPKSLKGVWVFGSGSVFGAALVLLLVFGPLQLGRVKVPIMLHDGLLLEDAGNRPEVIATAPVTSQDTDTPTTSMNDSMPVTTPEPENAVPAQDVSEDTEAVVETPPAVEEPVSEEPATATTTEPETTNRTLMAVTASILNVREQPNVGSDVIIKLAEGDRVWAYPQAAEGLWMQVRVDGLTGYASSRFLAIVE